MGADDVPSPIDFHNRRDAEAWVEQTSRNRPWRPELFEACVRALNERFREPFSVFELGSGPGLLAEQVLEHCSIRSYVALDFSEAMHEMARQKLARFLESVEFVRRDFRSPDWARGLGPFDAILTMQAAHEVRHKRRVPALLEQLHRLLAADGMLLFCDHYATTERPANNPDLFLSRDQQPIALAKAGFASVECLLDKGGMALYRATKDLRER